MTGRSAGHRKGHHSHQRSCRCSEWRAFNKEENPAASSRMSPGKFVKQCGQSREFCKGYVMVITGRGSPVASCTCGTVGSASMVVGGSSAAVVDVVDVSSVPTMASTVTMSYSSAGVVICDDLLCWGLVSTMTSFYAGVSVSMVPSFSEVSPSPR